MDVTFEFPDAFEFANRFNLAPDVVEDEMITAGNRVSLQGDAFTKEGTPVVSGTARRSITTIPATFAGGQMRAGWGSYGTNYIEWLENGRGSIVAGPGKVLRFKPKGSSSYIYRKRVGPARGRFMFAKAVRRLQPIFYREMDGALVRIVNRMGGA